MSPQLDLVFAPPPPTGPLTDLAKFRGSGTYIARYLKWRATENGERAYETIALWAVAAMKSGAERVEVNLLAARVRADLKVKVNNSLRSCLADELVWRYPELEPLIERRPRRAA